MADEKTTAENAEIKEEKSTSSKSIVEKAVEKAKEVAEEVKEKSEDLAKELEKTMEKVEDKLEEAGEFIEEKSKETRAKAEKQVEKVSSKVKEVVNETREKLEVAAEKAEEKMEQVADSVEEKVEKTSKKVKEVAAQVEEKLEEGLEKAEEKIEEAVEKILEKGKDIVDETTVEENKPASGVIPVDDFDWEAYESDEDYSQKQRSDYEEIYGETLTRLEENEVIEGTIASIGKKEVVVNIGYKSEGVIPASEFRYNPDLKVGDKVEVFVQSMEDRNGQMILSHKVARLHSAWDRVNASLENNEIITGYVKCRTKGGLIADVFGLEAFLPGSQIDVKPIRDYDIYVGKNMEFKVVKINQEFKNVVVSHKALIEAELEEQKKQIIAGLEKGQVLEGTVKNITSYGVFIDLGGVDGLIHITDLSWSRINHPEEVVELDQKLNVVILDFDDNKSRIALGLKQLQNHPWDNLDPNLKVGDTVKGKVVVLADYGAFVEIAPGVEGLVHVSEMSWSQHLRSAQDFLNVGDEVECKILTLDREERKMSLGIKQLTPDPWEGIEDRYPVGSKYKAKVKNFTNFGVFVEIEEGVDGLIHISDLSWSKKVKHPSEFCSVGDELEVVVLDVDREARRFSLGHKQLEENPWDVFETVFTIGSVHQGTVLSIKGNSAYITLPYGIEGFCPKKQLRKEDGTEAGVDEQLDFKVLEFNKNARKVVVSHTRTFEESPEEAKKSQMAERKANAKMTSKALKANNERIEKSTLGDFSVLSQLKDEMKKDEETKE
jgi:small subunit ribosomal protein S1